MSDSIRQGEAIGARTFGPFSAADVRAYAAASGDDNPLHTDPTIAAKAGLERPPIHGMIIMGCIEPYLRAWRPDVVVTKISGKFIKTVLVDQGIEVSGKVVQAAPGAPAVLRLMIRRDGGELACLAEAFVTA